MFQLNEQRKKQLDVIVQKMIQNKETDGTIQFVVDDFKKKYGEDLSSISKPTKQENKNLIQKFSNVSGKVLGGASDLLYGSSAKTIGTAIASPILSATGKTEEANKLIKENITPVDTAFTALELYPGGGLVGKMLKKIPGGETLAKGVAEHLSSIPKELQAKALEQYKTIFNATSKESKGLVEKVAPTLLKEKKVLPSLEKLGEEAEANLTKYGERINNYISKLPEDIKTNLKPTIDKLEKAKSKYIINGKVVDSQKINAINAVQKTIAQFGKEMPAKDTINLRRVLDESINEAGGFIADKATKYTAKIEKLASNSLRNEIAKDFPDLDKLNQKFSFWSNAKDLVKYTTGKKPTILRKTLASTVGGIVGGSQGEGVTGKLSGVLIGGVIGANAIKFMKSPAWNSVSAITKNKIADNLAKGNFKTVSEIFKKIIVATKNLND